MRWLGVFTWPILCLTPLKFVLLSQKHVSSIYLVYLSFTTFTCDWRHTFSWIHAEELCSIGAGYCNKLILIHHSSGLRNTVETAWMLGLTVKAEGWRSGIGGGESGWACSTFTLMIPWGSSFLTTALSQTTDILSSMPLVPSGIEVKLSLPTAFWAVEKLAWALEVTWRSPLENTQQALVRVTCDISMVQVRGSKW